MHYFVPAEDRALYHWQLELLLQSLKNLDISEKLFIGMISGNESSYSYQQNLNEHKHKETFGNLGAAKGFVPLNELYLLSWAISGGYIKSPICVLKAHTVIRHAKYQPFPYPEYPGIVVAPDPFFTFENAKKAVPDFWKATGHKEDEVQKNWTPFGNVFYLNNIGVEFINQTIKYAELLILQQIRNGKEIWDQTIRLAWAVNISEAMGKAYVEANYNVVSPMVDNRLTPIIDYEHGMPPTFNKELYSFPPPLFLSLGDPIEKVSELINTSNAHFMSDLALSHIRERTS